MLDSWLEDVGCIFLSYMLIFFFDWPWRIRLIHYLGKCLVSFLWFLFSRMYFLNQPGDRQVSGREQAGTRDWWDCSLTLSLSLPLLSPLSLFLTLSLFCPCYWFSPTVCINILPEHPLLLLPLTEEPVWITAASQACMAHTNTHKQNAHVKKCAEKYAFSYC